LVFKEHFGTLEWTTITPLGTLTDELVRYSISKLRAARGPMTEVGGENRSSLMGEEAEGAHGTPQVGTLRLLRLSAPRAVDSDPTFEALGRRGKHVPASG